MQWPKPGPDAETRRARTEIVILSSGDGQAIRQLGQLRRDPRSWGARLLEGAKHSLVLKVALGVFLGIVAAEAVDGVLKGDLLKSLAGQVDQAISDAGGFEAIEALAAVDNHGARTDDAAGEPVLDESSMTDPEPEWDDIGDGDLTDGLDWPF
jgi:hypothetical protein